jgi:hypothetical protein
MLSAEDYSELLDRLYRLLVDAYDVPLVKERIWGLIRWVEAQMLDYADDPDTPGGLEEIEVGGAPLSDFATLIAQAQQQNQQ